MIHPLSDVQSKNYDAEKFGITMNSLNFKVHKKK